MSREFPLPSIVDHVPGYEILKPTGEGAMGRVFVARQIRLDRLVALKFLAVEPDGDPNDQVARFRREAAIMAALKHKNVLPVFDFGEDDGRFYLVMEYVEAGDLRQRMTRGKPMPLREAISILTQVGEALDYLHLRDILHRDLKPENILMQGDVPKVADFGIAIDRAGSSELTQSGQGLGTLGYVAPELQYRLPVDARADQYSLAATAYEMLTGVRPLGLFKPPSFHNPTLTPAIDRVLMRALEESPEDRYPSVLAFVQTLDEASRNVPPPKTKRRSVVATLLVAAASIALFASLAQVFARKGTPHIEVSDPPIWPTTRSARSELLTKWRARQIWRSQGSPGEAAGAAVSGHNWDKAVRQVRYEVNVRADKLWKDGVSKHTITKDSEADRVWAMAEEELYTEWKVDPAKLADNAKDEDDEMEEGPP